MVGKGGDTRKSGIESPEYLAQEVAMFRSRGGSALCDVEKKWWAVACIGNVSKHKKIYGS